MAATSVPFEILRWGWNGKEINVGMGIKTWGKVGSLEKCRGGGSE